MVDRMQRRMFAERLAEQDRMLPGYAAGMRRLQQLLRQHGGTLLVPPLQPELLLPELLSRGTAVRGPVELQEGEPSQCHRNSRRLQRQAAQEGHRLVLWTGYALSDDGLWRQHSWLTAGERIVETTLVRQAYWGVTVTVPDDLEVGG